jgi:hypothetical protein
MFRRRAKHVRSKIAKLAASLDLLVSRMKTAHPVPTFLK